MAQSCRQAHFYPRHLILTFAHKSQGGVGPPLDAQGGQEDYCPLPCVRDCGRPDRTIPDHYQRLKCRGFRRYFLSFYLYSPFKGRNSCIFQFFHNRSLLVDFKHFFNIPGLKLKFFNATVYAVYPVQIMWLSAFLIQTFIFCLLHKYSFQPFVFLNLYRRYGV